MKINWHTDTPSQENLECLTTREAKLGGETKRYIMYNRWARRSPDKEPEWLCNVTDGSHTIAWCPLNEIKPYNSEK